MNPNDFIYLPAQAGGMWHKVGSMYFEPDGSAHVLGPKIFQRSKPSAPLASVLLPTPSLFSAMWKVLLRIPLRDRPPMDNMFRCTLCANKSRTYEMIPGTSRVRFARIFNLPCRSCQKSFHAHTD